MIIKSTWISYSAISSLHSIVPILASTDITFYYTDTVGGWWLAGSLPDSYELGITGGSVIRYYGYLAGARHGIRDDLSQRPALDYIYQTS